MDITLRQIKSFLAIARCTSFTQAANTLHLSQPALTAQMKQLESALKAKLFDRNTHHVRLTQAGIALVPIVQRVVGDLEMVMATSRKTDESRQEVIRVACLPAFSGSVLPMVMARLRKTNPSISLALRDVDSQSGIALVRSEEVECAVTLDHPKAHDLHCVSLLDDEMRVVYPSGHPIGRLRKAPLSAVSEYPLISLRSEDFGSREMADTALAGVAVPAIEVAYISSAIAMVQGGLGIAILPSIAINLFRSRGQLRSRRIDDVSWVRRISLTTKRGTKLAPAVENFIEALILESGRYRSGVVLP